MALSTALATEVGHSVGYGAQTGLPDDLAEQNMALIWPFSVKVYDRMRRDAKLAAVLRGWTQPIRSARWHVDPNGADDTVVEHIASDFGLPILGDDQDRPVPRARGRFSWKDHVRLAVTSALTYGHMPFEQVYDRDALKVRGEVRLRKLAPRMPQTIEQMFVARDGGLERIVQSPTGAPGEQVTGPSIPIDRLVMYVNDREGGAWQGQSLLRAAYAAWYLKQDALKTHAVSIRRNGMGVPVGEAPPGATQEQVDKLAEMAERLRGGEKSGGATAHGGRLRLLGVEGSLPDTLGFIRYLDEEMAGAAQQEFLKLGSSESGSRALGETFLAPFMLAVNGTATELIADTATAYAVEDIVDLQYGETAQAPRIVPEPITLDQQATALAVADMVKAGALTLDDEIEAYLRDALHLPRKTRPTPPPVQTPPATVTAAAPDGGGRTVTAATPRDPLPHEDSVDFDAIRNAWQTRLNDLLDGWKTQRATQLDELLASLQVLLDADDIAGLGSLAASTGPGADLLDAAMRDLVAAAAAEAVAEAARQGVVFELPELEVDSIVARAIAVDELLGRALADVVARQALLRYGVGTPVDEVVAAVREHVEGLTDTYLSDQLGGALTAAQNHGRFQAMAAGPVSRIYGSELMDASTCANCATVDGKQYATLAEGELQYPTGGFKDCLGGPRCRGTLVAVYATESEPSA